MFCSHLKSIFLRFIFLNQTQSPRSQYLFQHCFIPADDVQPNDPNRLLSYLVFNPCQKNKKFKTGWLVTSSTLVPRSQVQLNDCYIFLSDMINIIKYVFIGVFCLFSRKFSISSLLTADVYLITKMKRLLYRFTNCSVNV